MQRRDNEHLDQLLQQTSLQYVPCYIQTLKDHFKCNTMAQTRDNTDFFVEIQNIFSKLTRKSVFPVLRLRLSQEKAQQRKETSESPHG